MKDDTKVTCETPTAGKKPTRIPRWKYDAVRDAILRALPQGGEGLRASELPEYVDALLDPGVRAELGSVTWYTVTVKLDLEVKGLIERVPKARPQRLRQT